MAVNSPLHPSPWSDHSVLAEEEPSHPASLAGRHSRNAVLSWAEQEGSWCQFWDSLRPEQSLKLMTSAQKRQGLLAPLLWLSQYLLPNFPPFSPWPATSAPAQCRPQGQPVRRRPSIQSRKRQPRGQYVFRHEVRGADSEQPQPLKCLTAVSRPATASSRLCSLL